jgi:hypothetical protein
MKTNTLNPEQFPVARGVRKRITAFLTGKATDAKQSPQRQEARVSPEIFAAKMQQVEHNFPDLGIKLVLTGEADAAYKEQKEWVQKRLLARIALGDTEKLQNIRKGGATGNEVYALDSVLEKRFGHKIALKELSPEVREAGTRGSDLEGQFQAMQFLAAKQAERYPDGIEGTFRFAEVYGYMQQLPTDERPAEDCKEWLIMERVEGDHAEGFVYAFDPLGGPIESYIRITDAQANLSRIAKPGPYSEFRDAVEAGQFQDAVAKRLTSEDAGVSELKSMLHDLTAANMMVETRPDGTPGFVAVDMGHPDDGFN